MSHYVLTKRFYYTVGTAVIFADGTLLNYNSVNGQTRLLSVMECPSADGIRESLLNLGWSERK